MPMINRTICYYNERTLISQDDSMLSAFQLGSWLSNCSINKLPLEIDAIEFIDGELSINDNCNEKIQCPKCGCEDNIINFDCLGADDENIICPMCSCEFDIDGRQTEEQIRKEKGTLLEFAD